MKKLILTNVVSGVRKLGGIKQTLEHVQESYIEVIASMFTAFVAGASVPVSIHGCVNSGSGSTYNISAGAIWHNSEVFEIDAFAGTAVGGEVPVLSLLTTWRAGDPVKYSDGSTFNTHTIRKYGWAFGVSGSGLADFSQIVTLKSRINNEFLDVDGQIAAVINAAPAALDTLFELAAALNNDANFATTMTNALAGKVAKAGDTMTGNLTIPDGTAAGHAVTKAQLDLKAPLANPALTGTPTAPTAAPGNNTTQIATTAYVDAGLASPAWIEVTAFSGNWAHYLVSNYKLQYRKDTRTNIVWVKGVIKHTTTSPTSPSTIFVLPVGYRPAAQIDITVPPQSNAGEVRFIRVNTNGNVDLYFSAAPAADTSVRLQEFAFSTDGIVGV